MNAGDYNTRLALPAGEQLEKPSCLKFRLSLVRIAVSILRLHLHEMPCSDNRAFIHLVVDADMASSQAEAGRGTGRGNPRLDHCTR